jgi:transposase-like protein
MPIGGSAMQSKLEAAHFASEEAAITYIEKRLWPAGPVCPHCGVIGEATRMKGKTTRPGLWNCRACRKPFTVRMGTIFESSHVPMRVWLQGIYLMSSSKKGISTRQLQRTFGGSMKTAWFLGHRIREAMRDLGFDASGPLGGANQVVEADETYVGGKAANRKNKIPPKAIMVSLVERDGRVRSFHVPNVTAQTLKPIIIGNVHKATYLMTDSSPVYPDIGDAFAGHGTVNHSAEEYVRAYFWHTNTVENFFSIFKRGVYGCYFHVSEAHLHRYAAEFDFRHNHRERLGYSDLARADVALRGAVGKRLTYQTTRRQREIEAAPPF